MKVLVTLGTTPFPELLSALHMQGVDDSYQLTVQSPENEDASRFSSTFQFSEDINSWYDWADIIITHAGAGSIYRLLEQNHRVIVVPNTYRKDKHQLEISNYVEQNKFGLVCFDLKQLSAMIAQAETVQLNDYTKTEFLGTSDIVKTIFN